jgi:hypothetical protein
VTTIARFDTADFLATLYYAHKLIRLRKWYPSWFGYPCTTDIVIFRLLNRYRYLPLDFIQAHTGLSYSYVKTRLDVLARKPNKS